jgi:hypothetical protein
MSENVSPIEVAFNGVPRRYTRLTLSTRLLKVGLRRSQMQSLVRVLRGNPKRWRKRRLIFGPSDRAHFSGTRIRISYFLQYIVHSIHSILVYNLVHAAVLSYYDGATRPARLSAGRYCLFAHIARQPRTQSFPVLASPFNHNDTRRKGLTSSRVTVYRDLQSGLLMDARW